MTAYLEPGRFYSAPLNYDPELTSTVAVPSDLTFYDSTIRKILMTPGVRLTVPEFVEIAQLGYRTGMRRCFLNVHWWGSLDAPEPHALDVAKAVMAETGYDVTLFSDVYSQPNWREGVQTLISLEPSAVQICLPMPDAGGRRAATEMDDQIGRLVEICAMLRAASIEPTVGALDCARTHEPALRDFIAAGLDAGATRLDLSDSSSSLSPEAMKKMVTSARELAGERQVTMHVHNDAGLANSACLAAVVAGAHPDVSACGISYRAGFAALEVVAAALESMYGVSTGLDWDAIQALCARVGRLLPGEALRGVSGTHAFVKESPGPVSAYLRADGVPDTAPDHLLVAEGFGASTELVWGRQTVASQNAIRAKLAALGLPTGDADVSAAQRRLARALSRKHQYPVWLTDDEASAAVTSSMEDDQ